MILSPIHYIKPVKLFENSLLKDEALNVGFDGGIKLEFHGAKVIPLSGTGYEDVPHSGIAGKKDNGKQAVPETGRQ